LTGASRPCPLFADGVAGGQIQARRHSDWTGARAVQTESPKGLAVGIGYVGCWNRF